MKGSIVEVKGSRGKAWRVYVSAGRDGAGKRIRITRQIKGRKSDAQRQLRQIIDRVEKKTYVNSTGTRLREFLLDRWLPVARSRVRETTFYAMRNYCEQYVIPHLGGKRLGDIEPTDIQALHADLLDHGGKNGNPLTRHTVLKAHTILKDALGSAVDWELIARNPADRIKHLARRSGRSGAWSRTR